MNIRLTGRARSPRIFLVVMGTIVSWGHVRACKGTGRSKKGSQTELVNNVPNPTFRNDNNGDRFPRSVQYFVTAESEGCLHPTQKPVALMRYLVRTHTNPGDVVLDVACGSGTTCLAAMLEGRKSIGIEKEQKYAQIAINRIHEARGLGV